MAKAKRFKLGRQVEVTASLGCEGSKCYGHAVGELVRLLGRAGVTALVVHKAAKGRGMRLLVGAAPAVGAAALKALRGDGYVVAVGPEGVALAALDGKGVLNAVYELAELLGFAFLLPGLDGEWAPETPASLDMGELVRLPRFPHRGVFWQPVGPKDFSVEEWLRFYAKLRFNALSHEPESLALAEELGLRLEIGGHGFAKLLPPGAVRRAARALPDVPAGGLRRQAQPRRQHVRQQRPDPRAGQEEFRRQARRRQGRLRLAPMGRRPAVGRLVRLPLLPLPHPQRPGDARHEPPGRGGPGARLRHQDPRPGLPRHHDPGDRRSPPPRSVSRSSPPGSAATGTPSTTRPAPATGTTSRP